MEVCQKPDPSGVERTCVGSIFTEAAALLSDESPFLISAWKRAEISISWSSWRRMAWRNLSTFGKAREDTYNGRYFCTFCSKLRTRLGDKNRLVISERFRERS